MSAHLGIMLAITGGALGQLLMKSGLQAISLTDLHSVFYNITHHTVPSLMIVTGIAGYILSMAVWVHTLKNHPLNQAIPYLSLSYVLVCVLATVWPGVEEPMTLQKSVGVALIIIGVWYTQSPSSSQDSSAISKPSKPISNPSNPINKPSNPINKSANSGNKLEAENSVTPSANKHAR